VPYQNNYYYDQNHNHPKQTEQAPEPPLLDPWRAFDARVASVIRFFDQLFAIMVYTKVSATRSNPKVAIAKTPRALTDCFHSRIAADEVARQSQSWLEPFLILNVTLACVLFTGIIG